MANSKTVLVVGAIAILGFVVWHSVLDQNQSTKRENAESTDASWRGEGSAPRRARNFAFPKLWARSGEPEDADRPAPLAVQAGPEAGETTPGWSELSRPDRIAALEDGFQTAIDDIASGDPTAAMRANDALTALRFELYDTPEGRSHHAELEARLEALTEAP